jgi:hypothetical protein
LFAQQSQRRGSRQATLPWTWKIRAENQNIKLSDKLSDMLSAFQIAFQPTQIERLIDDSWLHFKYITYYKKVRNRARPTRF